MRLVRAALLLAALAVFSWPAAAQSTIDLGVKTAGRPIAPAPYTGADSIVLVRGTSWNRINAAILNPCDGSSGVAGGTIPAAPNDPTKVLNGACQWVTGGGGGGGGGSGQALQLVLEAGESSNQNLDLVAE